MGNGNPLLSKETTKGRRNLRGQTSPKAIMSFSSTEPTILEKLTQGDGLILKIIQYSLPIKPEQL